MDLFLFNIEAFFSINSKLAPAPFGLTIGFILSMLLLFLHRLNGGELFQNLDDSNSTQNISHIQLWISLLPFSIGFRYAFEDISIFFSLIAISITFFGLLDGRILSRLKATSIDIKQSNDRTADLLQQVQSLSGIKQLSDMNNVIRTITDIMSKIIDEDKKNKPKPKVTLVSASPALGSLHIGIDEPVRAYAVKLSETANILKKDFKIIHYDISDGSLEVFAKCIGLSEKDKSKFIDNANVTLENIKQFNVNTVSKTLKESIAEIVFNSGELPSVMLFHMFVVEYENGEMEMVLWHVERTVGKNRTRKKIDVQGFWTNNASVVEPFVKTAMHY